MRMPASLMRGEVDDGGQVVDVGPHEVVGLRAGTRPGERDPLDALEPGADELVGPGGDDLRRVRVRGAAVRRVVLEAAVVGRVVRRGDDDAVGETGAGRHTVDSGDLAPVGDEDRVRHRRSRRVAVGRVDEHGDVVGDEHLEGRGPRRLGQPVGVATEEERPVEALRLPVVDDRLRRREDVVLVERRVERGAAVARGAEGDLLVDVVGVRLAACSRP